MEVVFTIPQKKDGNYEKFKKKTQRKTNDKIMVLEMARYEYYGWAPE